MSSGPHAGGATSAVLAFALGGHAVSLLLGGAMVAAAFALTVGVVLVTGCSGSDATVSTAPGKASG